MKVSELTDDLLDCWVAKCINPEEKIFHNSDGWTLRWHIKPKPYSNQWLHGGVIIELQKITICAPGFMLSGLWEAFIGAGLEPSKLGDTDMGDTGWDIVGQAEGFGETPLIAAMRAYVASIYGDEVPDIPA